ncbi:MAG: YaaR family protein [Oscillospiraceae bacterium]
MAIQKTRRTTQVASYGINPAGKGSGNLSSRSFQSAFQGQLKEHYKGRATALFDEITAKAPAIFSHVDIKEYEKYRRLIGELLNEVVNNAYSISCEQLLDASGKARIYTSVKKINSKLEGLADDLLSRNCDNINYLGRIDEIRGLVMDLIY